MLPELGVFPEKTELWFERPWEEDYDPETAEFYVDASTAKKFPFLEGKPYRIDQMDELDTRVVVCPCTIDYFIGCHHKETA